MGEVLYLPPLHARIAKHDRELIPPDIFGNQAAMRNTTYGGLLGRWWNDDYGQHMANNQDLRFAASFGYNRNRMAADLGADGNALDHNALTYLQVSGVILEQKQAGKKVDRYEEALAKFVSGTHDAGESMHPRLAAKAGGVVGDIPFGQKTADHKLQEARVRQVIWDDLYYKINPLMIESAESVIMHIDQDRPAHVYQEAAHSLGALSTGIRIGQIALIEANLPSGSKRPDKELQTMARLAVTVTSRMQDALNSPEYGDIVAVERTLTETAPTLQSIQSELRDFAA